ncbi:MATE family efflux transporter [Candidatus Cetobacterium colombiensis]|jgi:putative MATE family efflux protein|uniref:MATE family efflux transporter n=1 Tax=Candidatus Cetobacterium colombiensis TaxID=3073100 RepID=A0ABU4W783_9FUSO|nr:MATE family efflux transporter [Candidatus Cetobacterium colombiensis]MDX8335089.1 MATE family efflux transporter [Candidatus Cetobacterium colombiensis]
MILEQKKSLFSITIPIFLELLLVTVVGNIDTIMLGRFSDKAVGAVGGMSQVLLIQNTILSFICLGTTILMAQFIGAKNYKSTKEVIAVSLLMNLIIGLFLGLMYFIGWEWILTKIKLPPNLREMGMNYFKLVGGLCVFQAISLTNGAILKSYGNTKPMLFINVGVNLLNILGNGMFIFGWLGAPILGVTGVGLSTVFSRFIGAIISLVVMTNYCKFAMADLKQFTFEKVKQILSIGIPTAGEHLTWSLTQVIILAMVNTMGTIEITARTYLALISSFIMIFSIALGHGTAIQVGQLVGADDKEKAYNQCLKSLTLSFVAAAIVSIVVYTLRYTIMELFTKDMEVVKATAKVFPWLIFIETGRTFNIVVINALHAAGDIKFPMIMGCFVMLGVAAPLSWILGIKLEWALVGVWIANGTDEWIRGFAMLWRWRTKKWMTKSFV